MVDFRQALVNAKSAAFAPNDAKASGAFAAGMHEGLDLGIRRGVEKIVQVVELTIQEFNLDDTVASAASLVERLANAIEEARYKP